MLSLGVTTFELLTGRLPFAESTDRAEVIRRQLNEPLPSARATRADLPAQLDEVLARATAKRPDERHATIAALVTDLIELLDPSVVERNGRRRTTAISPYDAAIENPYVGLNAFQEGDADRFHGREALVTELVDTVAARHFVAVVGASGSGKSSVVRAGLVPALRRGAVAGSEGWFIVGMVPGSDPIAALEAALLRIAVNPPASLREQLAEAGGLLRAVQRVLPDDSTEVLVVIDQFEELFTMSESADRDRFLEELAAAISAPRSPLRVVATMRADHYDRPLQHRAIAELTSLGTVAVRPMTPGELERAIVQPAARVDVDVEPALLADLLAGTVEQPAALPLLQFALTEGFERRVSNLMLQSVHQDLGGLTGAVAARADRIVDAGGDLDEVVTRRVFGRLVTFGEGTEATRRRALRSEFADNHETGRVIDQFVAARLLTSGRDDSTREPTIEVAHEALLRDWPRLSGWLDEDRDDLRTLRGIGIAADAWRRSDRDAGELGRGGRLDTVSELHDRRPDLFNEVEAGWVAESRAAALQQEEAEAAVAARDRRQNRRLRQLLAAAGALIVLALIATTVALVLRDRAETSEQRAVAAQQDAETARAESDTTRRDAEVAALAGNARVLAGSDPVTAMLLALEASGRASNDEPAVAIAMLDSLSADPRVRLLRPPVPSLGLVLQPRSGPYYSYISSGEDGGARVDVTNVDDDTTQTIELDDVPGAAITDPTGRFLLVVSNDRLLVYDVPSGGLLGEQPVENFFVSDIGPDGDDILAAYPDGRLVLHALPSFEVLASSEIATDTFAIARSGDGRTVALLDGSGTLTIRSIDGSGDPIEFPLPPNANTVALDTAGARVAVSSGRNGPTYVVDLADPSALVEIPAGANTDLVFGPDDRSLAIGTSDGIEIYDITTGELVTDPLVFATDVNFHFTGGRTLRAFASNLGVAEIDLDAPSRIVQNVEVPGWGVAAFLAPDLSTAVTIVVDEGTGDVTEQLIVEPGETPESTRLIGPTPATRSSRPILDGRFMTADTTLLRYEESDGSGVLQTVDLRGAVTEGYEHLLAPRVGGTRDILILAEAGEALLGNEIVVVDRNVGEVTMTLVDRGVTVAEFADADESDVIVGDLDGRVRWFDSDGTVAPDELVVGAAVGALAVTSDGARIAVGDWSGTVTIVDDGRDIVAELANDAPFPIRMAFVDDGERLVVQSEDGSIVLWDVGSASRIGVLARTDGLRGAFEVVPDGSAVVVANAGGISTISIDPDDWHRLACESVNRQLSEVELRSIVADIELIDDPCSAAG